MLTSKTLLTGAALLIATTSTASAGSFSKSYEWGNSNFGVEIDGSASGSANNKGKITIDADGSFKARLFGGSKTAKATFDGAYGDGTRKMSANLKIDGIVLSSKSKTFGSAYVEKPLQSKELFHKSKQFTVWGVPVVVIADVTADASIGFGVDVDTNGSMNFMNWENEYEVYGKVGASGTITAGPGSELGGVGVYGSITIGEVKLAAVKSFAFIGGGSGTNELQLDLEIGTFETGVVAWIADAEASAVILEIEGFKKNLKTIDL